MNKLLFYPRLALTNLGKNHKTYLPYLLTCIGTVMLYYILHSISLNPGINDMPGDTNVKALLFLGTIVIALFSIIFLFYTNSFLVKRRKKEFGLYQVLGMEKKHLVIMLFFETLYTFVLSLTAGLAGGALLSKLMYLLLLRIVGAEVPLSFAVPPQSLGSTALLFLAVFALTLLANLWHLRTARPVELILGGQTGEREPKTPRLLTVLGILSLAAGYGIALAVRSPLTALILFFLAVVLVIAGTYLLFTSCSIAVLKRLRANRRFYYQTQHFTTVAGMLHRMKQNAVGLANICILSTMVLVLLSTTASLYFGQQDMLAIRFPRDVLLTAFHPADENAAAIDALCTELAAAHGLKLENRASYQFVRTLALPEGDGFTTDEKKVQGALADSYEIVLVPLPSWSDAPQAPALAPDEVLLCTENTDYSLDTVTLDGHVFRVAGRVPEFCDTDSDAQGILFKTLFLFTADAQALAPFATEGSPSSFQLAFDLTGGAAQQSALIGEIRTEVEARGMGPVRILTRTSYAESTHGTAGGFLFIGLFLGGIFLMATVLIIYYKQITEGFEDQARFSILRKVGMSLIEVRRSIRAQILMVFFLPLGVAVMHVAVAFPLLSKLLALFGLFHTPVFLIANAITILVFAIVYVLVFAITAREYYKIVRQ